MLDTQREQWVENISFILLSQLLAQSDASFEGLVKLKQKIRHFVSSGSQIKILLPAFPCKTNNLDKVLGYKPDMGEYLALKKFVTAIRDIQAVYEPGVMFYIFSDYHTFSDYISVDLEHHYEYSENLKNMVKKMNCSDCLKIVNFEHFTAFDDLDEYQYFTGLKDRFGDPGYEKNFADLKRRDNKMNNTYLGLKKFMTQDQKHILSKYSHKDRRLRLAEIAKGMMVQGNALDNFLNTHFGEYIRLSIHEHPMIGKKYSLFLFNERQFKTPWHSTIMFDAKLGKFLIDTRENHLSASGAVIPVYYNDTAWCYICLSARNEETANVLRQIKATLHHEKSGLVLDCQGASLPTEIISRRELGNLVKEFGTVTLKGFETFSEPAEMENWYCKRGPMVPWPHSNVQIITSQQPEQPALPLHWKLMCPPSYLDVCQDKYGYEDYTPDEFALYCHQGASENSAENGCLITVDAALAVVTIDGQERERLRATSLRYLPETHSSECESMAYPLIVQCPLTQQDVIRWAQRNSEHVQSEVPGIINAELASSDTFNDVISAEHRMMEISQDARMITQHSLQEGDLILINNHSTLVGAQPMKGKREWWQIQIQPSSVNSPWQPHNRVELNQAV